MSEHRGHKDSSQSKRRKEAFTRSICCTGPLKDCVCDEGGGSNGQPIRRSSIKDFKVIDCLGKGGFGSVYLVSKITGDNEDETFALKVVDKNKIKSNSKDIEHAITEMEIMAELEHPFIVKVFDVFESPRRICYLMEFLQGGELYTWLERKNVFEESVACYYLAQIFLALVYLHEEGILYRDLKPENIMFDVRGNIKLVDFGLSQNHMTRKRTKTMCGTTSYMPPEVIRREWYSFAADWWSFGILAYDMMIGVPPFMCDTRDETREAILHCKISFPSESNISSRARVLIKNLVAKNPKDRLSGWKITQLAFFDPIDFKDLYEQALAPPLVPKVSSSMDMTHFPPEAISSIPSEGDDPSRDEEEEGPTKRVVDHEENGSIFAGFSEVVSSSSDTTSHIEPLIIGTKL